MASHARWFWIAITVLATASAGCAGSRAQITPVSAPVAVSPVG